MGASSTHFIGRRGTAAIAAHRILKGHTEDGQVTQAALATEKLVGIAGREGCDAAGDHMDVAVGGIAVVEYGGAVAYGDLLTSDAQGRAVAATVSGSSVIGQAQEKGVLGTLGSCLIAPSKLP